MSLNFNNCNNCDNNYERNGNCNGSKELNRELIGMEVGSRCMTERSEMDLGGRSRYESSYTTRSMALGLSFNVEKSEILGALE